MEATAAESTTTVEATPNRAVEPTHCAVEAAARLEAVAVRAVHFVEVVIVAIAAPTPIKER